MKRNSFTFNDKAQIIEREQNTCEKCGVICENFYAEIHHKDLDSSNNSLNNGILLCPNCHSGIHKKFYEKENGGKALHTQEEKRESARKYNETHKEEKLEYARKYREKHKEEDRKYQLGTHS